MRTRFVVLLALLCSPLGSAAAQNLSLTGASLPDGTAGVALQDTITFSFSRKLPFNTRFIDGFQWEPDAAAVQRYVFLDAARRAPDFGIDHQPDTDYAVFVFGVQSEDGNYMARPFTLNYTTGPTAGPRRVTGTVRLGERTIDAPPAKNAALQRRVARAFPTRTAVLRDAAPDAPAGAGKAGLDVARAQRTAAALTAGTPDLDLTVAFLLDDYTRDDASWRVRAAAAPDAEGRYAFGAVRDGVYWPMSITFSDLTGETVGAYGFYDADGDLSPDSIVVSGGDVPDVPLSVFAFTRYRAADLRALAEQRAALEADDQRLLTVSAAVDAEGAAFGWTYAFYSPSLDRVTYVQVGAVEVTAASAPPAAYERTQQALPAGWLGTDQVRAIADANGGSDFIARPGAGAMYVTVKAGDLDQPRRPAGDAPYWYVSYFDLATYERFEVFLDLQTGAVLDAVNVGTTADAALPSAARLGAPYPNPFRASVTVPYELDAAGPVALRVFDVLGREVATLVDGLRPAGRHAARWAAGDAAAGVYVVRIERGGTVETRALTRLR